MPTITYLVCGFRVDANTELTIALRGGASLDATMIVSRPDGDDTVAGNGAWATTLAPGDQIVRLEGPDYGPEEWLGTNFELSAEALLVTQREPPKLGAWTAASGGSDPKDPWPPPVNPPEFEDEGGWFVMKFAELRRSMTRPRAA